MKNKHAAQLRHHIASTRRISVSAPARRSRLLRRSSCEGWIGEGGFSHLRALLALIICSAAACSMLSGALLAFFHAEAPITGSQRTLTFAQRAGYQRAIEEVYWRHRIWPKENAKPKPSLDEVVSAQQIEKKVEDYLRDSRVLEAYGQKPIASEQLQ